MFSQNRGGIMIAIDTKEKLDWLLNALENNEIQLVSRRLTKEDREEISRELAEYRAAHPKTPAAEAVLA
jgi:membrane-bound lytic murein transglycosylase MltF